MQNFLIAALFLPAGFLYWLSNTQYFQDCMVVMRFLVRKWYYWLAWLLIPTFALYASFSAIGGQADARGLAIVIIATSMFIIMPHLISVEVYKMWKKDREIAENEWARWRVQHLGEDEDQQLC